MDQLIQIKVICSSISLFSSTTVALLFLSNPKLRTPTFRLVLQLQIADALFALASIINSNDDSNGLCVFQAFLVNYSRESSIVWIGIFAYNMCATIVDNQELPGLLKFYVVAIGIPFILSAYPFAWDAYGLNYSMCWLLPDSIALMVVDYLVLCIGILFYIIYFYIKIYNFLYNVTEMKSYKLFLYPLSFLLTQIWTMIDIFQKYDQYSTVLCIQRCSSGICESLRFHKFSGLWVDSSSPRDYQGFLLINQSEGEAGNADSDSMYLSLRMKQRISTHPDNNHLLCLWDLTLEHLVTLVYRMANSINN
ncbi:unnamed protein product (macronuclear) [Paramecium tetraurelia]|uniref:G-protein coupled receptors family 2 profile 2 domain-containing protein n=1 Tax=Paramecium tetraurelia TaxID=5888 RepID=A0DDZ6_PARTE|nr:uncharacterized protein GSPATT00016105001 [Paramecium tetraurelia]CAK81263.1 unnamed protein product [Paramecium tetraurelia]|eukprot:XP_001448660.1 hypothetical protein (macronuclear) [Paramecium tetraurelia strain d4-2]